MIFHLAPMEGVLDSVLRSILTEVGGIDLCVTEFLRVNDRPLPPKVFLKHMPELLNGSTTPAGTPVVLQLLGGQPGPMAENAKLGVHLGAKGIDLNFGCPAKTVNRHDGGAALLRFPERIFRICESVRGAVPQNIPVSAKIRLGYDHKEDFLEIAKAVEGAGLQRITVHARTKTEGYRPPAHWEFIAHIRSALNISVVANGEIWSVSDFLRCQEVTGCSEFMLGRGLIADPFLALKCKGDRIHVGQNDLWVLMARMIGLSEKLFSRAYALGRWKQWSRSLGRNYSDFSLMFEESKRLTVADVPMGVLSYFKEAYPQSTQGRSELCPRSKDTSQRDGNLGEASVAKFGPFESRWSKVQSRIVRESKPF